MVIYRLATENDYKNINDFYNRMYDTDRTLEQFYWNFHNGPAGKALYVIAEDGDQIVGTNCVIPMMLKTSKNELILTGKSEDTLVDSAYRGQNIFNDIYDYLFEKSIENGIRVIWGFTSAKKPFQKLGFSIPFDQQQSLIVHDITKSYDYLSSLNPKNTFIQKCKILSLCFLSKFKATFGHLSFKKSKFKMLVDTEVTSGVDKLVENEANSYDHSFYIHQDEAFQKWRIYENPYYHKTHTYSFYNENNELQGLIVLNSYQNGVAYINQNNFDKSLNSETRTLLLRQAIKHVFNQKVGLVRNWHFDTNALNKIDIEVFKKANFIILRKGIGFVWKDLDKTNLDPKQFYLSRISTQGAI